MCTRMYLRGRRRGTKKKMQRDYSRCVCTHSSHKKKEVAARARRADVEVRRFFMVRQLRVYVCIGVCRGRGCHMRKRKKRPRKTREAICCKKGHVIFFIFQKKKTEDCRARAQMGRGMIRCGGACHCGGVDRVVTDARPAQDISQKLRAMALNEKPMIAPDTGFASYPNIMPAVVALMPNTKIASNGASRHSVTVAIVSVRCGGSDAPDSLEPGVLQTQGPLAPASVCAAPREE